MIQRLVVDTGPLVAFLSDRDRYHAWAASALAGVAPPLLTCEAVLAEAWHLLRATSNGHDALLDLLATGAVVPEFTLRAELVAVRRLVTRYRDRPMSLADACLVRMAELYDEATVMTVDKDFAIYRKHSRQTIPLLSPFA